MISSSGSLTENVVRDGEPTWLLQVTDIKQYEYCPRVVYYHYCMPEVRPTTFKMKAGVQAGRKAVTDERRRSLRTYGLGEGERSFNVPVASAALRLSGVVDLVIQAEVAGERRVIPVDYKMSRRKPGRHYSLQLVCYGMLLEEATGLPAPEGFIYLTPIHRAERILLDKRLRNRVKKLVGQIVDMVEGQRMPWPARSRARCIDCEFRRFCNDVV